MIRILHKRLPTNCVQSFFMALSCSASCCFRDGDRYKLLATCFANVLSFRRKNFSAFILRGNFFARSPKILDHAKYQRCFLRPIPLFEKNISNKKHGGPDKSGNDTGKSTMKQRRDRQSQPVTFKFLVIRLFYQTIGCKIRFTRGQRDSTTI